jgi:hypothetical protein
MRQIEKQMLTAIHSRKDWKSANTEVVVTYFAHAAKPIERTTVLLHGSPIAEITHDSVAVCDCGLNAILHELCGAGIYQKAHKWYGTAIEESDWEIEPESRHVFVRG